MIVSESSCDVLAVLLDVGLTMENSAVFQTQLGDQLVCLSKLGYRTSILTVYDELSQFEQVIGKRLRAAKVHVFLVKKYGLLRNLFAMAKALYLLQREQQVKMVYVRGIWGACVVFLANPFRPLPYVYDVRGALSDEAKQVGFIAKVKRRVYMTLESWCIRKAKKVSAVSTPLAELISNTYDVSVQTIVPCCVHVESMSVSDEMRIACRQALGYRKTDVVFVYSGGLSHYQQIPFMLNLWRCLLDISGLHFLLLTQDALRDKAHVVGDLTDFGSRIQHMSVSRTEIPKMLSAADIGFVLRDGRELNRMASPVKFAEYLAARLAVVASPGTGDSSVLVEKYQLGVLVEPCDLYDAEQKLREFITQVYIERAAFREKTYHIASTYYDWQGYTEHFLRLYGEPSELRVV